MTQTDWPTHQGPSSAEELVASQEQKLSDAKAAIAGPTPLIPEAPDTALELRRGLFHKGAFKKTVRVRELTGMDEEQLAKVSPADHQDAVIALGVESIDDFALEGLPLAERQTYMRSLLIGERDQIYLKVVQATFGNEKTVAFTCPDPECAAEQEVTFLLDTDFPVHEVEDLQESYTHETSKGQVVEYRLINGDDQWEVWHKKGANVATQNTEILARCITRVNNGLIPDPHQFARKLPMRDRQAILAGIIDHQPSVSLEVTTTCTACGREQPLAVGWRDLFRP